MSRIVKRALWVVAVLILAVVAGFGVNYSRHDLETAELNAQARQGARGQFATTSLGIVHYQIAGPADARTVVLVHGFSVPYYLWDTTFPVLRDSGFRVLRYDLMGRGLSDRPNVDYDAELYDTQLRELLDALKIAGPIDLIGCSMGGPIVATFASRHPERVRTLSFFDPGYSHGTPPPFALRAQRTAPRRHAARPLPAGRGRRSRALHRAPGDRAPGAAGLFAHSLKRSPTRAEGQSVPAKKTAEAFAVTDSLLAAWATNDRINAYLIENLPTPAWRVSPPGGKGRDIAAIVAHMHNVRLMWLKATAQDAAIPAKLDPATCTPQDCVQALEASRAALAEVLREALTTDGRVKSFKPDACGFLAYLLAHDAHHRGQITMLARQLGHPLSKSAMFGLWQWGAR